MSRFEERAEDLHGRLEESWCSPEKQRQYNKQGKELLAGRAVENYLALAGDLALAELQKKQNRAIEQRETRRSYEIMEADFENARSRLAQEIAERKDELLRSQDFRMRQLKAEQEKEVAAMQWKIGFVEKMLAEEKRAGKTVSSKPAALPMLNRTVANISTKNQIAHKTAQKTAQPLALPPLQVKKRRK
jgi:hypothetical protein